MATLAPTLVERWERDGFAAPIDVLSEAEGARYRGEFDELVRREVRERAEAHEVLGPSGKTDEQFRQDRYECIQKHDSEQKFQACVEARGYRRVQ